MLEVEQFEEREGYNPTEVYKCIAEPDLSVFDEEEKKMLDRIVVKYGHLNGKQLEELSHAEAPYIGTELRKEIPYELAFIAAQILANDDSISLPRRHSERNYCP